MEDRCFEIRVAQQETSSDETEYKVAQRNSIEPERPKFLTEEKYQVHEDV